MYSAIIAAAGEKGLPHFRRNDRYAKSFVGRKLSK
jgi:hypothetical protein